MVKTSTKTSIKSKKNKTSSHAVIAQEEKPVIAPSLPPLEEHDSSKITVCIESYHNIVKAYQSSNIYATCSYLENNLGQSEKIILTDDALIMADHEFNILCNLESPKELDQLVSNPVLIKIFQNQLTELEEKLILEERSKSEHDSLPTFLDSIDSAISLYEALTGDKVEIIEPFELKGKKKSKKGLKDEKKKKGGKGNKSGKGSKTSKGSDSTLSKGSKASKKSKTSKLSLKKSKGNKDKITKTPTESTDTLVGSCIIDLLPLVFGKTSFTQFLPIDLPETFCDERMITYKTKPGLTVTVSIDKPIEYSCTPTILSLTLESIFNIPSVMKEDMEYHVCVLTPSVNLTKQPLLIKSGEFTTSIKQQQHKFWPGLPKDFSNKTNYSLEQDSETIKSYVHNINLSETISKEKPKIQFNCIKRNILLKEGFLALHDHVRKFQRIVLEIHAFKKSLSAGDGAATDRSKATVSRKKTKTSGSEVTVSQGGDGNKEKPTQYLHLMSIIDLSPLLYPGITKIRVATPLTTFHEEEALLGGGLEQSYFFPPVPKALSSSIKQSPSGKIGKKGKKKSKDKKSKSSKSSKNSKSSKSSKKSKKSDKSKSSKKGKGKKKKEPSEEQDLNMKNALPPEPAPKPPPEPSMKVYNEDGEPTFIVLEIEITQPLVEKKSIDDLHHNLQQLIQEKPQTPKVIFDSKLATEYYHNLIKEIIIEINILYADYIEASAHCHCETKGDFLIYLRRVGAYQSFTTTIANIAALLAHNKLKIAEENEHNLQYQDLIQEIFIHLSTEVNQAIHKLTTMGRSIVQLPKHPMKTLLFYAKEATEMKNLILADRYYLERLFHDPNNPDHWFEYAVFQMERGAFGRAFMCLQEALSRKMYHRNSLLMNAILLSEKKQLKESEICLLTLMVQEPRWVEGWGVLYLFYKDAENVGGMDLALEMATKHLDDPRATVDDFMKEEDLAWTPAICPNTLFFRIAIILLKMRLYSWVEHALAHELKEVGVVHYLLAVICYYKKKYEHALEHLEKAKYFHGQDWAVVSLTGHCLAALDRFQEAHAEYLHILTSFDKPKYLHLVHLNCAKGTEDNQEARKLLLIACKNNPTPYTWMSCGIAYFKQNDLISAEECFSEAVLLDNSLPDCWGYLALINVKLKRSSEAELCYNLALKNNLENTFLIQEIEKGYKKLNPVE